ncbi:MAG: glycosyltransferase [bacterium]
MRRGDWESAVNEYRRSEGGESDPLAANDFAVALHLSGRSEEALEILNRLGDDNDLPVLPILNRYYLSRALEAKAAFDIKLEHKDHDGMSCPDTPPLVSVLVRTYNRPDLLKDALQSLAEQTFRDFETIVVNDGGEPTAEEIVNSSRLSNIRYFYAPHQGNPAALNRALEMAHGKYVTILDDDDIFYSAHLKVHVEYLEKKGTEEIACSKINKMKIPEENTDSLIKWEPYKVRGKESNLGSLSKENYLTFSLIKRECYIKAGRLFENIMAEDLEMWLRLTAEFAFHQIDKITGEIRERPKTTSTYKAKTYYGNLVRMMHGRLILASEPANQEIAAGYKRLMLKLGKLMQREPELIHVIELSDLWTMRKPYAWLLEQAEWLKKIEEPDLAMEFIKTAARLAPYQFRVWKRMYKTRKPLK